MRRLFSQPLAAAYLFQPTYAQMLRLCSFSDRNSKQDCCCKTCSAAVEGFLNAVLKTSIMEAARKFLYRWNNGTYINNRKRLSFVWNVK